MYTTDRLTIRTFVPGDIVPLTDLFSSSEAMRFIGPRRAMIVDESKKWLQSQMDAQSTEVTRYAVALKDTNELIGVCGFRKIDGAWDFGYYFRPSFWGRGFASEACICLLGLAEVILKGEDFIVFVGRDNVASHRVMERCGLRKGKRAVKDDEEGYLYIQARQGVAANSKDKRCEVK